MKIVEAHTKREASKLFTADEIVKLVQRELQRQIKEDGWAHPFANDDLANRIIDAIRKAEKEKKG